MSTQLGGLRLLGASRASLASSGTAPRRNIGILASAIFPFTSIPNLLGTFNLLILGLIFFRFILFQLASIQVTMRLKAGPTWDNVELSDLVWARHTNGEICRSASMCSRSAAAA